MVLLWVVVVVVVEVLLVLEAVVYTDFPEEVLASVDTTVAVVAEAVEATTGPLEVAGTFVASASGGGT